MTHPTKKDGGDVFGQEQPPLYLYIKGILQRYPGGQIFKEIIQNADDAGAKKVIFYLDNRQHGTESLIVPGLEQFQGPSLLSFNDAKFTAKDWESIQKPEQSGKEKDPFKVGKFGLGFNSVYHITDLPTIISGPTIAFMEPQGKVWQGQAGRKYTITSPKMQATLAPFDRIGEFCTGIATYPSTLFRFPLRLQASGLSKRCYDIEMLKELLEALKDEAQFLLIFLRSVVAINVVEVNESGEHINLFEVSINSCDRDRITEKRQSFLQELKSSNLKLRKTTYRISYEAKFHVTSTDEESGGQTFEKHWLVTATVGSDELQDLQAANKLHVLPWVGCALELDNYEQIVDETGGRIFCFLPLPNETRSPLPIHVNGTFGLNDNRRSIKWPSTERKHDSTADWNMTIVKSLLPHCYALLISNAIKEGVPSHYVYASWPQCDKLKRTSWPGLMQPLFDILFQSKVLWSKLSPDSSEGKWVSLKDATIISSYISPVVYEVLSECGLHLVDYNDHPNISGAVRYANKKVCDLSSSLARQVIRSKKAIKYQNLPSTTKHELLHFCLLDGKFNELEGLELLPLADGSFATFALSTSDNACYVCSERHPSTLLPGLSNRLVDLTSQNENLHKELLRAASTKKTQLQTLNPELVAHLLPECMPPEWNEKMYAPASGTTFSRTWFETFWKWVARHNLDHFKGMMVLPVVMKCSIESELCIARLVSKSCIISVSENSIFDTDPNLMRGLEKLDVYFTGTTDNLFPYLQHCKSLKEYVYTTSPNSVMSALKNMYKSNEQLRKLNSIKITTDEAKSIQKFFSDIRNHDKVLMHLPILMAVNCTELHSITSAAKGSWGDKAVMLTTESNNRFESKIEILPPNLVLLRNNYHQKHLVVPYKDMVDSLHWVDFILRHLFPMIQANKYPHSKVELLMEEILEQLTSPRLHCRASLIEKIKKISFLKKGDTRVPPCKLFDPDKPLLSNMLPVEMFPKEPFNKPSLLRQLRECGLRQTVTAQEILKIIQLVNSKNTTDVNVCRAKALLDYLDCNQKLLEETVDFENTDRSLSKAIYDVSKQRNWLPQLANPPDYYPSCLRWKGKTLSSLVKLGPEVLVCNPNNIKRDCLKVGSAVCIVPCPASLSTVLKSKLSVKMVVNHLNEVIKCYKELDDKMDTIMECIYEYLLKRKESYSELKTILPRNWIWMKSIPKFLSTKSLCLKRNSNLQQGLEPYMYLLPDSLQKFSDLFRAMGVKETVTNSQLLNVLASIKKAESDKSEQIDNNETWMTVMAILTALTCHGKQAVRLKEKETLYVPTNSEHLQLEDSSKVCYADCDFLQDFMASKEENENEDMCVLCHENIKHLAPQLNLTPLSEHYELSEDLFEDFGPYEPLVLRLNNILRDYTDGITIIKELLQNADDAGATEVNLCYDARRHDIDPKTLLYSGMSETYGPALVVHNDAVFTDDDFQNITKLAAATKKDKPLKIGKFGVGFCSVYHITDVPSFVSREYLYIFDPTLQYLKKHITDKSRPGKRLNFTKKIATLSKQLVPFIGLNEFRGNQGFKGTMFRFPFRTTGSEISQIQYTEHHIGQLRRDISECGDKLLLFLQSVKRLTFSRIDEGDDNPHLVLEINKELINSSSTETQMLRIDTACSNSEARCSHWVVGIHSEKLDFDGKDCDAVSSVACRMKSSSETREPAEYQFQSINGEVFCFLPLSVVSGLPVHVSANFAVQNDRTGIRTSADHSSNGANEAEWNIDLIKSTIPKAYFNFLSCLSMMYTEGTITEEYKCYSFFPLKKCIHVHNPWDFLLPSLYSYTLNNRLLYSQSTQSWLTVSESMFLSSNILSTSQTGTQTVQKCVQLLNLPVVDLPPDYHSHIPQYRSLEELEFVKIFFKRIDELQTHYTIRNEIIKLIFQLHWNAEWDKKETLTIILQQNKCVPCSPNGELLQYCSDVIDQRAFFADLYEHKEGVFAVEEFQKYPTNQVLIELGMISETLHPSKLSDRASTIETLYLSNQCLALKRAKIVLKCLSIIPPTLNHASYYNHIDHIKATKFIPVMQKPQAYPEFLLWSGDKHTLSPPSDVYYGDICGCLAGSQICIACTDEPENGGCGDLDRVTIKTLGMKTMPKFHEVMRHFKHIIDVVNSSQSNHEYNEWLTNTCSEIYKFMEKCLIKKPTLNISGLGNCVWTGSCFVSPEVVATNWVMNGPYLYPIPSTLNNNRNLIAALKIEEDFSVNTLVETLKQIKDEYSCEPVEQKYHQFVLFLVTLLGQRIEKGDSDLNFYLPDSNFVMQIASDLKINDVNREESKVESDYVHASISADIAIKLGVQSIRAKLFDEYEDTDYEGEEFGQSEELTERIKNILEDYPLDITVLKELLQNADDAKATKMMVILDKRTHGMDQVPSEEWKDLQGPALIVWNNSTFRDEDLIGIQRLGLGSKRSQWETIGMYGIGFNVVYHLTDCPSFISTEVSGSSTLCILDPHCRYIPGANSKKPGRRFNNLDQKFWQQWSDMGSAYLRENAEFKEQVTSGSLFRFPLRHKQSLIAKSDLVVEPGEPMEASKMETFLMQWAPDMKESLFFLNSVTELKFFVIDCDNKVTETQHYIVTIDKQKQCSRIRMQNRVQAFTASNPTPHIETYSLTLAERLRGRDQKETKKWIIQQGVGDIQNPKQNWQFLSRMKPKHGIAVPLHCTDRAEMHMFCFLPLPTKSNLPVHINGSFILNSSRRQLWQPTTIKHIDDKTRWNRNLIEAIASSYAHLLTNCQDMFIPKKATLVDELLLNSIEQYYNTFPVWLPKYGLTPEGECLSLAEMLYDKLYEMKAAILVHLEEKSKSEHEVTFLPLVNDKRPSFQAYFYDPKKKELNAILRNIGMQLTEASVLVYEHFFDREIELFRVTKETVFRYYSKFHSQVFSTVSVKCEPIEDTKFKSVEEFKVFTMYILSPNEKSYLVYPETPFNLPLLLTADGYLGYFNKEHKAIRTEYSELFKKSKDKFLHPEMMDIKYEKDYFLKPQRECWEIVSDILSCNLPRELMRCDKVSYIDLHTMTKHTLTEIWECFGKEEFFLVHLKNILETWALIPSTNRELFSLKCSYLPIMNNTEIHSLNSSSFASYYHPTVCKTDVIFEILLKLNMPVIDHAIVQEKLAEKFCPKVSDRAETLKNLFNLHQQQKVLDNITLSVLKPLLQYINNIHLGVDRHSLARVKALPLFQSVDGKLCSIKNGALIWPEGTCDEGKEYWIHRDGQVFLDPRGDWTCLSASVLGIEGISQFKLYSKFIFPVFYKFTEKQRLSHLEIIKNSLYNFADNNCKYLVGNTDEREFIQCLKVLSFIPRSDGTLHPVSKFADPRNKCIKTFDNHFQFPPTPLCDDEWLDFLIKIGLHKSITTREYQQFCFEVSEGKHSDLTAASKALVDYLFQEKEWHEDRYFLEQVSKIPFVVAESLDAVKWIHECAPTERVMQQGKQRVCLTSFCKAADYEHHKLIWTVKPVVLLPSYPDYSYNIAKQKRKELLLSLKVSRINTTEVVANIKNISSTKLSDIQNFDTYSFPKPKKDEHSLLEVFREIFKFLDEQLHAYDSSLSNQLKSTPCIPVCAEGNVDEVKFPVLVKPIQVIASSSESIREFMPFLSRLPNQFYSILPGLLARLGVEQEIMLRHVQGALETIHTLCGKNKLDINSQEAVKKLISKLYELLYNQPITSEIQSMCTRVLYLPNSECILVDSKTLLYQDCEHFRKTTLMFETSTYSELYLLVPKRDISTHYKFNEKQLCNCLPVKIAPKPLAKSCREVMSTSCRKEASLSSFAKELRTAIRLPRLASGACAILKHNSNAPEICKKLQGSLEIFFRNTEVVTVKHLTVDLLLEINKSSEHIGTAEVDFHIDKNTADTFMLYVDKDARKILFFENLSMAILSLAAEMCGVSMKDIKKPQSALTYLLKAQTSEQILSTLRELDVSNFSEREAPGSKSFNPSLNPVLGDSLPESWHHRLQQDYNNLFRPGEWVGYEIDDGHIVFAIIGYKLDSVDGDFIRYYIYIEEGEMDGVEVSILDIYKILRSAVEKQPTHTSSDMMMYEGHGEEEFSESIPSRNDQLPKTIVEMKREICEELEKIWKLSDPDMKRKAVKRMYLKWHPDKNLDNSVLAGEAFKFLKRQIDRLEQGKSMESPDESDEQEEYSRPNTSSYWDTFFKTWDSRAHNHFDYEQSDHEWRSSSRGSAGGASTGFSSGASFNFPDSPTPDIDKAQKWIRQAECDYTALSILFEHCRLEVCANICFLAHEVAEKSLKAGMLAVWGLRPKDFTTHKKMMDFAINLEHKFSCCTGLLSIVLQLPTEKFYYKTRWPNMHGTWHEVPADHFDKNDAITAKNNAGEILDMMKYVLIFARRS